MNHRYHYMQLFTHSEVDEMFKKDLIIDARDGGLIMGPKHLYGGVIFVFEYSDGFRVFGEVEGYEYIIKRDYARMYIDEIRKINEFNDKKYGKFINYDIPPNITIIDARIQNSDIKSKIIILDVRGGFAIINKVSTRDHLRTLELMNSGIY